MLNKRFYGVEGNVAVSRLILKENDIFKKVCFSILPPLLRTLVYRKSFFQRTLGHDLYVDFVIDNPEYLKILNKLVADYPSKIPYTITFFKEMAEIYQLGISTVQPEETLILDEGFSIIPLYCLPHIKDNKRFIHEYFRYVPVPDIIIHVDAPSDICDARRVKYCSKKSKLDMINKNRKICFEIADHLKSEYDTKVIYVENTGTFEEAVEYVEKELKKLGIL